MPYRKRWNDLRQRQWICMVAMLGLLPAYTLFRRISEALIGSDALGRAMGATWSVCVLAALAWLATWSCPRCERPFFSTFWLANPFARRCMHCKLPKWETPRLTPDDTRR